MCEDCFTDEIKSFEGKTAWIAFDLELTRRLQQGKVKHINFVRDMERDKDDGEEIYRCMSCGQGWKLKNHYDNGDGYFLKLSTLEKITTKLTERQKLILGILIIPLLILIRIIYWICTN
jgi:hypothetical protein